jgi:two-component system LytT family sensor kinase
MEDRKQDFQRATAALEVTSAEEPRPISFWRVQAGIWLVYLVMIYATFLPMAGPGVLRMLLIIKAARALFGFALSSALRWLYRGWVGKASLPRVVALAAAGSAGMGVVWAALATAFATVVNPKFNWISELPRSPRDALDYSVTLGAWSAAYFLVKYRMEYQAERERSLRATSAARLAELQMLRYQINPHFLFNALNSVHASIGEDAQRAKRMITELAEFLRFSLLSGKGEMVELREELQAIRSYLAIESIRFEESLEVSFEVDSEVESVHVPPFLVCPLVENAVKHGMHTSSRPLRVKIRAKAAGGGVVQIEILNSGGLRENGDVPWESTGTGVCNVRERVAQIYGERGRFDLEESDGWVRARLELPAKLVVVGAGVA